MSKHPLLVAFGRRTMVEVTRQVVRDTLIAALANVEGVDEVDIQQAIDERGGDDLYELQSKTAEAVLAEVGEVLSFTPVGPADLKPEQFANLEALVELIEAALNGEG